MIRTKSSKIQSKTLRISEAAKLIGVNPMTLRRWDNNGILKAIRMGNRSDRRYLRTDILNIIKKGTE